MKAIQLLLVGFGLLLAGTPAGAESDYFKDFKDAYDMMGSDLAVKPPAELGEVTDFVYQKDVATFTFKSGKIYLLREVSGRPTTAIFLGEGHADIKVPSHVERQSLWYAAGDSTVNEDFQVAFMDFSDDLDLKLKEKITFEHTVLPWRDFNKAQQGEFFFKPATYHTYDNYFELLRSQFERKADGYFYIDFNRYGYSFDPNRPEEVLVAYEHEGGDQELTEGAVMQRMEKNIYDDYAMSNITYPTTILSREADMTMGGLDGQYIEAAQTDVSLLINADSLRFMSLFLHHNLDVDSVYYNGAPCDFLRRGSFTFMGVILPEYRHREDTITLRIWYHGKDYQTFLPFVENPAPSKVVVKINAPSGYNYCLPASQQVKGDNPKRSYFVSEPSELYRLFAMQPLASGFDTVTTVSDIGLTIRFLKSSHVDKNHYTSFIPNDKYERTVTAAVNCLTAHLGAPQATFVLDIYPLPGPVTTGLVSISQVESYIENTGGLTMNAADMASREWFGPLLRPVSDREYWIADGVPDYLSLTCVFDNIDSDVFFGELRRRRAEIYRLIENDEDKPLATGRRVDHFDRAAKGCWIMHMLYCMMLDDPAAFNSNKTFWSFLNELKISASSRPFSNADVKTIAEKYYGRPLDRFFDFWLFGRNVPEFEADYRFETRPDGKYVVVDVSVDKVPSWFTMPVIMRVEAKDGTSVKERHTIDAPHTTVELGPYSFEPKELFFNEYHSVLSRDKVKKK